ncbi:hypothetical protein RI054_22g96660 [Pseudoscourfieldia marina]
MKRAVTYLSRQATMKGGRDSVVVSDAAHAATAMQEMAQTRKADSLYAEQDLNIVQVGSQRAEVPRTIMMARREALLKAPSSRTEEDVALLDGLLDTCRFATKLETVKRHRLCAAALYVTKSEGDVVFRQGERGEYLYLILSGAVRVLVQAEPDAITSTSPTNSQRALSPTRTVSPDMGHMLAKVESFNKVKDVATLYPGDAFGELALMSEDSKRTATVVCTEPSEFFIIRREDYQNTIAGTIGIVAMERVRHMRGCTMLRSEKLSVLQEIAHILVTTALPRRALVYKQGAIADRVFLITKGQVSLVRYVNAPSPTVTNAKGNMTDRSFGLVSTDRIATAARKNRAAHAHLDMYGDSKSRAEQHAEDHKTRVVSEAMKFARTESSVSHGSHKTVRRQRSAFSSKKSSEYLAYRPLTHEELFHLGDFGVHGSTISGGVVSARRARDPHFHALKNPFASQHHYKAEDLHKQKKDLNPLILGKSKQERLAFLKKQISALETGKKATPESLRATWHRTKQKVKASLAFKTDYDDEKEVRYRSFIEVERCFRHDLFGYVEVSRGTKRQTSAVTHEHTELVTLAAWDFLRRFSKNTLDNLSNLIENDRITFAWSRGWDEHLCEMLGTATAWDSYAVRETHNVTTSRDASRWKSRAWPNMRNAGSRDKAVESVLTEPIEDLEKLEALRQ